MSPRLAGVLFLLIFTALHPSPSLHAEDRPLHLSSIPDQATFTSYGEILDAQEWGKFVIDLKELRIHYFDVKLFPLHRDFVFSEILQKIPDRPSVHEYNKNYGYQKPRFILGYIAHHLKSGRWDFSFWAGDLIEASDVRLARAWIQRSFFVDGKDLYFRPESAFQERLLPQLRSIPTVTNDQLYKQVEYQAMVPGRAIGRLRIVPANEPPDALQFQPDEIVILQESYPDITKVAGIVTATLCTPLSHVNLRARAWRIPNATYRDAGKRYAALAGKQVLLEVREATFTLREATPEEIASYRPADKEPPAVELPKPNFRATELRLLDGIHRRDVTIYGAKAANLGEIVSAHLSGVEVPAGFGVPFSAYRNHLQKHGIFDSITEMLSDPRYATDVVFRKQRLDEVRQRILSAEVDPAIVDAVFDKIQTQLSDHAVFVRSSTNAEDLPNFNGAGLYYTAPNVKGKEALATAMKAVWASLWSLRAAMERRLYRIDERTIACGLLIVESLSATAAGVLVTRHLFDPMNDHAYTINAQRGLGLRVVDGKTTPEQVVFNLRYPSTKLISRSSDATMLILDEAGGVKEAPVPSSEVVITNSRARVLSEQVRRVRALFPYDLDVEWVLQDERFYIVQARAFIGGDAFPPLPPPQKN